MSPRLLRLGFAAVSVLALAGCMVGPDYRRPATPVAGSYKEAGWSPAEPADLSAKGDWWTVFDDPTLNALEASVAISNQNVAAAEAAYRQSEALVREQRAALFPAVDLDVGATRTGSGKSGGGVVTTGAGGTSILSGGGRASNAYRASVGASWDLDVWGRIRRSIEGAKGAAQASEADLAGARLSAQAALAADYFDLRESDAEAALLREEAAAFQQSLKIAQNRYDAGLAPRSDVLQAQSQLASTQADLEDLERRRAAFEHAVATLVGQTPEAFGLAREAAWDPTIPQIPAGMPSALLQRRPDIAAAERRAASASAQIGVETAAYFPSLTLTGSYGFAGSELGRLFDASASVWSIGASVAQTVFDAGLTHARVDAARAGYDQAVAQYRQTVLAALQDVEDQLAASRVLAREYEFRRQAAADADRAATIVRNQYRAGQVAYANVLLAQTQALDARRTALQAALGQQTTAVALIQGLGGGWTTPAMATD